MSVLVSVVMAAHNGEKYLKRQAESILRQTYSYLELIIADDASTDGTFDLAQKIASSDSRVKVLRNAKNMGFVKNFLAVTSSCKGDFIFFSDQDDWWEPRKVEILKTLLEKNEKNMLAYSDLEICDEDLGVTHDSFWREAGIKPQKGFLGEKALLRNLAPGCSMAFRRAVADQIGVLGPELPFVHDHLVFGVAACLGSIVYSREKLVKYRQHPANNIGAFYPSIMDRRRFVEDLRKKIEIFKRIDFKNYGVSLKKLEKFCDQWSGSQIRGSILFLPYLLFLRKDTVKDKALGLFECILPGIYKKLRERHQ